jgi:hypothetical protein
VVSMFAVVAIVIAAPFAAHARALDHVTVSTGYDHDRDAETPWTVDVLDVPTVSSMRVDAVVDLDGDDDQRLVAHAATLSFAPKTSPPLR